MKIDTSHSTDPLSQMKDIHLPEVPNFWPLAPGWWLILLGSLLLLVCLLLHLRKPFKKYRQRKAFLSIFKRIEQKYAYTKDKTALLEDINTFLKRVCLSLYSHQSIASLTGEQWLVFLDQSGQTQEFTQGVGLILGEPRFQGSTSFSEQKLIALVKQWISKQSEVNFL